MKNAKIGCLPNKSLHLTAIPLRSIAAGELGRYAVSLLNKEVKNGILIYAVYRRKTSR